MVRYCSKLRVSFGAEWICKHRVYHSYKRQLPLFALSRDGNIFPLPISIYLLRTRHPRHHIPRDSRVKGCSSNNPVAPMGKLNIGFLGTSLTVPVMGCDLHLRPPNPQSTWEVVSFQNGMTTDKFQGSVRSRLVKRAIVGRGLPWYPGAVWPGSYRPGRGPSRKDVVASGQCCCDTLISRGRP